MHICCGDHCGSCGVFPYYATFGDRVRVTAAIIVVVTTSTTATVIALAGQRATSMEWVVLMVIVVTMVTAVAVRPRPLVRRQVPALKRRGTVAGGFAVINGRVVAVNTDSTVAVSSRVPATHPHAVREEQLEE